ncbi:hypothetical protein VTI28DRAFT_1416 [Corynascus sepedonium]
MYWYVQRQTLQAWSLPPSHVNTLKFSSRPAMHAVRMFPNTSKRCNLRHPPVYSPILPYLPRSAAVHRNSLNPAINCKQFDIALRPVTWNHYDGRGFGGNEFGRRPCRATTTGSRVKTGVNAGCLMMAGPGGGGVVTDAEAERLARGRSKLEEWSYITSRHSSPTVRSMLNGKKAKG